MNAHVVYQNISEIILWIGLADALLLIALGFIGAAFLLFQIESQNKAFWYNLWPAILFIVVTNIAAIIILMLFRWFATEFGMVSA